MSGSGQRTGIRQPTDSCAVLHFVFATRNIVTRLESVVLSGNSGAAAGGMAGNPLAGAAGSAQVRVFCVPVRLFSSCSRRETWQQCSKGSWFQEIAERRLGEWLAILWRGQMLWLLG